jgi:hypothetical protein
VLQLDSFLSSALDIVEYSSPRPDRFTPATFYTVAHWIGGSVGSRPIGISQRGEKSFSSRASKHVSLVVQPVSWSLCYNYCHCVTPTFNVFHLPSIRNNYRHRVTSAANVLHLPSLCYTYRHCVTPTATVLHLLSMCYNYRHCVTPTATVLHLPSLCYTYRHCVTTTVTVLHLPSPCYTYRHRVTTTVTVLQLPSLHLTSWHWNVIVPAGFTLLVESLMCCLVWFMSFWNWSSVVLLIKQENKPRILD